MLLVPLDLTALTVQLVIRVRLAKRGQLASRVLEATEARLAYQSLAKKVIGAKEAHQGLQDLQVLRGLLGYP